MRALVMMAVLAGSATIAPVQAQDAVLLLTDHTTFDYELIARESDLLVDTRGKFPLSLDNLVRA